MLRGIINQTHEQMVNTVDSTVGEKSRQRKETSNIRSVSTYTFLPCEGFWSMHPVVPQRLALAAVRLTT